MLAVRKELKFLLLAEFLLSLGIGVFTPFYALFAEGITHNASGVSLSYAVFWVTVGLLSPVIGSFSDKFGKKLALISGGVLSFIVSLSYLSVDSLSGLLVIEFMNGIATACFSPAYNSFIAELTSAEHKGRDYGIIDSVSSFTYALGAIFGSFVIALSGISFVFIVPGLFQMLSSFLIVKLS